MLSIRQQFPILLSLYNDKCYFARVTPGNKHIRLKDYVESLTSRGRYHFEAEDVSDALGVSRFSANNAVARLSKQGLIASPAKGFYVIVPPEYRSLRCLPAEQFIPALFERKDESYHAGLLTAAQYYGAAHQRPQAFQVFVARSRKAIQCGSVKVFFIAKRQISNVPTRLFNTPRGILKVSTPEATAIDLVGYVDRAGGLDTVATVLADLAEAIDPGELGRLAQDIPIVWTQRLGHLLDQVDQYNITPPLLELVSRKARDYTPLAPGRSHAGAPKDKRWKIHANTVVETDL